jgi:hypothetical protein
MRHRAGKTLAGTVAIEMARSNALVGPTSTAAPARNAQRNMGHCQQPRRDHGTRRAARCASRCAPAEPRRRGERPPLFERTLTGVRARRPSRAIRGRSPLRPGRSSLTGIGRCRAASTTRARRRPSRDRLSGCSPAEHLRDGPQICARASRRAANRQIGKCGPFGL